MNPAGAEPALADALYTIIEFQQDTIQRLREERADVEEEALRYLSESLPAIMGPV